MTTQGTEDQAMSSTEFSNPIIGWIEKPLPLPFSIGEPVLTQSDGKVRI